MCGEKYALYPRGYVERVSGYKDLILDWHARGGVFTRLDSARLAELGCGESGVDMVVVRVKSQAGSFMVGEIVKGGE